MLVKYHSQCIINYLKYSAAAALYAMEGMFIRCIGVHSHALSTCALETRDTHTNSLCHLALGGGGP